MTLQRSRTAGGHGARKALILGSTALGFLALEAAPAFAQMDNNAIQEIVVTARKREETLVNVPVAVSAVTGAELSRQGLVSLSSIADQVPQMLVARATSGAGAAIAIRGIGSPATDPGIEASVSINVDGVQVSRGFITQASFFDLAQVEVLKGPQSLFFGKNSPAGVISLTSNGPGNHFEGFGKIGYEFTAREKFGEAGVGGPVSDTFGFRLAVRYSDMDGYMYNDAKAIANPFAPQYPLPGALSFDRAPASKTTVARLTLDWHPTSEFNAVLKVLHNKYTDNGITGITQVVHCSPIGLVSTLGVPDPYSDCKADNHFNQSQLPLGLAANFPYYQQYGSRFFTDTKVDLESLRMNYKAGPITFTSVTGLFDMNFISQGDFDYTNYTQFVGLNGEKDRIWTQEIRALTSFDGPLNAVVGAYYEDNKRRTTAIGCGRVALGPDPATGYTTGCINNDLVLSKTYSAFGQLIWAVSPTIEIAAGARYTKEKKSAVLQNLYVSRFVQANGVEQFASLRRPGNPLTGNFKDDNWSPEVTASWHPQPNSTVYAAYRTGYKSGGFSTPSVLLQTNTLAQVSFNSETAKGGEVGYKAELLDRRLLLDMDIYRYKFNGLQRASLDIATTSFVIRNAASATSKGAELTGRFRATDELTLNGAVAYNKSTYGAFPAAACYNGQTAATGCITSPTGVKTQDLKGFALSRAPKWVITGGVAYNHPVAEGWNVGLNADFKHSSAYRTQDDGDSAGFQGAYTKINAGIRLYQPEGHWEIGFTARNITNKYILLSTGAKPGGSPGDLTGTIERPRELTLQGAYRF